MKCKSKMELVFTVFLACLIVSGCSSEELNNDQLVRDARLQKISEQLEVNMEANKQEAIAEIAPHLDRLVANLAEVCDELESDPGSTLLDQCKSDLARLSNGANAIKSGDFDRKENVGNER